MKLAARISTAIAPACVLTAMTALLVGTDVADAQIVIGPYTFSSAAAFADSATSTNCAGGIGYPSGDCNDNVIGYSPTVCNANINLDQPVPDLGQVCTTTDYVQLTFDDIPITNVSGPDLIVFDSRFSTDGYGIAVELSPGVFSNFEVYSPDEEEELEFGSGCAGATLAAVPVDLSRYGLPLAATSGAIRVVSANFGSGCQADLTMAGVLDGSLTCTSDGDCNDGDPCTSDTCAAGSCSYVPIGCTTTTTIETTTSTTETTSSSTTTTSTTTTTTIPPLDHFKCYKIKAPKFAATTVNIVDQFGTSTAAVTKFDTLCNPVDKNGEGIKDSTAHLQCYKIKDAPKAAKRTITSTNQFGSADLGLAGARTLCVPSIKDGVPSSLLRDYFKCYKAKGAAPVPASVALVDQFATTTAAVGKIATFCTPTSPEGGGLLNPVDHLACYKIKDAPKLTPHTVQVQNELAPPATVTATKARLLCVPSQKTL